MRIKKPHKHRSDINSGFKVGRKARKRAVTKLVLKTSHIPWLSRGSDPPQDRHGSVTARA